MRISALAQLTRVPVATLKYYLREGLLPAGERTAQTQAQYDHTHVDRVRLIRALVESGGLGIAAVRQVLDVLDDPPESRHDLLRQTHDVLVASEGAAAGEVEEMWLTLAAELAERLGPVDGPHDPLVVRLATQLRAVAAAGVSIPLGSLDGYVRAAVTLADADLSTVPEEETAALRQVVVGTLLTDPLVLTMRRIAQRGSGDRLEGRADGRADGRAEG